MPISTDPKLVSTIKRAEELERQKEPWKDHWQLVGEYIHTRKQEFNQEHEEGEFLNRDIFDSTAPRSAKIAASSIISMLWPQSARRLRLSPPITLKGTREEKEYYEWVTETLMSAMDDPKAGLQVSLDEYMLDEIVFATAGIEGKHGTESDLSYRAWGVKHMAIDESANGFVDTVYLRVTYSIHQLVKEYGIDEVSKRSRDLFNNNKLDTKVKILIAIEPRVEKGEGKRGNQAKPWSSMHIELDAKHKLKETGFDEIPIKVARFKKLIGERYGRGPGMDALPDTLEMNAVWEATTVAIEKSLDPPLAVLNDGSLGAQVIDTSAGAINVFNISGRAGEKNPIFPLFTVGEIKQVVNLIEKLDQSITDHFMIDRLLDFNNESQMTLGEAQLRNRLRNASLSAIFSRQISELFNPLVEQSFNLMFAKNKLGVVADSLEAELDPEAMLIPESVAELMRTGQDVYRIEYFTPAMRVMQAEEAEGILRSWEMAGQIAATTPSVLDKLNADVSIERFTEIVGGPSEIIRADSEVETIREERDRVAQEQAQQEQLLQGAEAARNLGQSGLVPGTNNQNGQAA